MDRTNWAYGETPLNLLVLGVVLEGFTLPLLWVALAHGGCSDSATRERLGADREFIGRDWFTFLRKRGIRRVIRLRADTVVDELRTDVWFHTVQTGQFRCLFEKGWVHGSLTRMATWWCWPRM